MTARPVLLSLVALTFGSFAACGSPPASQPAGGRPSRAEVRFPVEVQEVATRQIEYAITAVGSVAAFERIEVTARVAGVVEKVQFAEGDLVGSDQVLIEIEPERYRLAVEAARATFARGEASQGESQAGLERRQAVNAKNPDLVKAEDVDSWRTRTQVAAADVEQARVALALAELNLRDALVKSPFAGVVQTRTVQTGQYVQPGTVLATLLRREPLLLRFSVPSEEASRLHPGLAARFTVRDDNRPYQAEIRHVADSAAEVSRMVEVTARVDDPRRGELRPGAFAQVVVPIGGVSATAAVPETAIRSSERGFLAYVVDGESARERIVTLGLRTADGLVEVRSGLAPGERLVVRGAEALTDGAKVREIGR